MNDSFFAAVLARLVRLAVLVVLATSWSWAQVPKVGKPYVDDSRYGFSIKMPKDWEFVPAQPGEAHLLGKYDPPNEKFILIGTGDYFLINAFLLCFDNRPKSEERDVSAEDEDGNTITISMTQAPVANVTAWVENYLGNHNGSYQWRAEESKAIERGGLRGHEFVFSGKYRGDESPEVRAFAVSFEIEADLTIAAVFTGPGKDKKWYEWEKAYRSLSQSFKAIELRNRKQPTKAGASSAAKNPDIGSGSIRDKKRTELNDEIRRLPGWKLYETQNYFVLSSTTDEPFVKDVLERLELIRAIYEHDYPPANARRAPPPTSASKPEEPEGESGPPTAEPAPDEGERSVSQRADPMELSRTSVVRVCKSQDEYHSYGGPGGSAGYWNSSAEELVLFDDKAGGGRGDTWAVLNHEAFHQYIFYFYGSLAPHSWYNEGTGDFYAGYELSAGRFKLTPFKWRVSTVREMIREGSLREGKSENGYVPLEEIVRWTQGQYYGNNEYSASGFQCYAQGWSLIYFLRAGKGRAPGWNDAWNFILEIYLETLADTGDLDQAVDKAFEGVDWTELESSWKAFIG